MSDDTMPDDPQEAISSPLPKMPLSVALRVGDLATVLEYAESTVQDLVRKYIRFPYINRRLDESDLYGILRIAVVDGVLKGFDVSRYERCEDTEVQRVFLGRAHDVLTEVCERLDSKGAAEPRGPEWDRRDAPLSELGLVGGLVRALRENRERADRHARNARNLLWSPNETAAEAKYRAGTREAVAHLSGAEMEAEVERCWQDAKAESEAAARGCMRACKVVARASRAALIVLADCAEQAARTLGREIVADRGMSAIEAEDARARAKDKNATYIDRTTAYADEVAAIAEEGLALGRAIDSANRTKEMKRLGSSIEKIRSDVASQTDAA